MHQELSKKQKPRTIRAAVFILRRRFYSASFLTAHPRELSFPIKGTLALHCQVARLVSESFLMLVRILSRSHLSATKFCVIANTLSERFIFHRQLQAVGHIKGGSPLRPYCIKANRGFHCQCSFCARSLVAAYFGRCGGPCSCDLSTGNEIMSAR